MTAPDRRCALAACIGRDPERFFPIRAPARRSTQIAQAKAVCAAAVKTECLEYVLGTRQNNGTWAVWPKTNGAAQGLPPLPRAHASARRGGSRRVARLPRITGLACRHDVDAMRPTVARRDILGHATTEMTESVLM
jgi:hypothetical protein